MYTYMGKISKGSVLEIIIFGGNKVKIYHIVVKYKIAEKNRLQKLICGKTVLWCGSEVVEPKRL
jgi:Ran GTPase-activating protein (RanGAP) involved in mRNA processing and transport